MGREIRTRYLRLSGPFVSVTLPLRSASSLGPGVPRRPGPHDPGRVPVTGETSRKAGRDRNYDFGLRRRRHAA